MLIGFISILLFADNGLEGFFANNVVYADNRSSLADTGIHPNSLGALGVYCYIYSLFYINSKKTSYIPLVCSSLIIILSLSRIAWIVTLMVTLFYYKKIPRSGKLVMIFLALVIGYSTQSLIYSRLMFGVEENAAAVSQDIDRISAGRIDKIWKPGIRMALERPLLGYGLKTNVVTNMWSIPPHNAYLKVLLDMGVIGLICLLSLIMYFTGICKKESMFLYFLGAILLLATTGHSFYPYKGNYLFWIILGITIAKIDKEPMHKNVMT